jgi:hypothetical protein
MIGAQTNGLIALKTFESTGSNFKLLQLGDCGGLGGPNSPDRKTGRAAWRP